MAEPRLPAMNLSRLDAVDRNDVLADKVTRPPSPPFFNHACIGNPVMPVAQDPAEFRVLRDTCADVRPHAMNGGR